MGKLKEKILDFLDKYQDQGCGQKVNKNERYYKLLKEKIPREIREILNRGDIWQHGDLHIHGTVGQGYTSKIPMIGIFNNKLAYSLQCGLYIVILFSRDLNGFYLTIAQGITYFQKKFQSKKSHQCIMIMLQK